MNRFYKNSGSIKKALVFSERTVLLSLFIAITILICTVFCITLSACSSNNLPKTLVLQSDFGTRDSAVSAMKGVATSVDNELHIYDNTHDIEAFSIYEGAYRIGQAINYWPEGTVFVSVVDPGVGSDRKSVVAKTSDNKYVVTPDNGTLSTIKDDIIEVREIDETKNRLPGSSESYTFHGRDVYAYTGARLASGQISFEEVGPILDREVVTLNYQKPQVNGKTIKGGIDILDVQYGNVWTNISSDILKELGVIEGSQLSVKIAKDNEVKYQGIMPFCNTFSQVPEGQPLAYYNSLMYVAIALNQQSFAQTYGISYGEGWTIEITVL